jgi:hypothetical protein
MSPSSSLRALLAALLLTAAVSGCAFAPNPVAPLRGVYTYESYDRTFSLAYPLGWEMTPVATLPEGATFAAVSLEARAALTVSARDAEPAPPTPEVLLAGVRQAHGPRLREGALTMLNGVDAVRAVADTELDGRPMRVLQYVVTNGQRIYELTLRAPAEAFPEREAELEAIAASFKLR